MLINNLLDKVQEGSLPYSKMHISVPVGEFKMTIDMIDSKTYNWLEMSEIVKKIECGNILEGVAHDVEIIFDTPDGVLELVDIK